MSLIELENINYEPEVKSLLKKEEREFHLSDISFKLRKNKVTAIVGESGSGKTTLGKILAGIIEPDKGTIKSHIKQGSKINPIQILFQNSGELINPHRKVEDYLKYPSNEKERVLDIITKLKLPVNILLKKNGNLSGGERQRIALARILLSGPELLILDEPFSAQDIKSQLNIKEILLDVRNELQLAMVVISHGLEILDGLADEIMVMNNGVIIESGNYDEVVDHPLHPYTLFLLKASKFELKKDDLRRSDYPEKFAECRYYINCPVKIDICKEKVEMHLEKNHKVYCNKPGEADV